MQSFKLEKSEHSQNNQVIQLGVFIALIGLPVLFLVSFAFGGILIVLGLIMAIGGKFAS